MVTAVPCPCQNKRESAVDVAKMTMNLNVRTYMLYDAAGGAIIEGKLDDLRQALGL